MNRTEALNILGLDDDASASDVKAAYRECVQILHPDRFANNKRLQERATEQFKRLQDAYDFLTSGKGSKKAASRTRQSPRASSASWNSVEAQLAGLAAARTQLIAQRDTLYDERRNALIMIGLGAIGAILLRRIVWVAGIAGTLVIWGVVKLAGTLQSLSTIDDHLREIDAQRRQLEEEFGTGDDE